MSKINKKPKKQTQPNTYDKVLWLARIMENWDKEKMRIFFENVHKIQGRNYTPTQLIGNNWKRIILNVWRKLISGQRKETLNKD